MLIGAVPVRRTIELAIQVAHGLAVAHERGIVHRDLKPENLFLTREARANWGTKEFYPNGVA